jgi:mannosylglycerate hydrolase
MNATEVRALARAQQSAAVPRVVMLVPGTHYDLAWQHQEWYIRHEFQSFMSGIVSALERSPKLRFSLDGQAILALWWLKDVSHQETRLRRKRLQKLARNGQLEIGPALVIPDEFLAPEMALLQNLRIGSEVTASFGGKTPEFFDMSDTFGHVAQMAQLMKPFADYLLFSRGLGAVDAQLTMFTWRSPDGTSVIAVPQQGGYQSGRPFGRTDQVTSLRTVEDFLEHYGPRYEKAGMKHMLLYLRGDYKGLPERLEEDLAALKHRLPRIKFVLGSNAEYIDLLKPLAASDLPVRHGELAGSGDRFILRGVNSMRMDLKLTNERVYRAIITTETAASLALLRRGDAYYYPRHDMTRLWSDFLVLQSHDAITGCHSDQVFRDMMAKLRVLEEEADWIKQKALAALAGRTALPNHDNRVGRAPTNEFALLNLLPYQRSEVAIVPLPPALRGQRRLRAFLNSQPAAVKVQRLSNNHAAVAVTTGSFGSVSVKLEQNSHAEVVDAPEQAGVIQNEYLRAEVAGNGTLTLTDLTTGRRYPGQHLLVSEGDGGDTYTFAPVADRPYDSRGEHAKVRHLSNGPLVWELEIATVLHLPKRLDKRTRTQRLGDVAMKIKTVVRLRAGSKQLEFETTVQNRAEDHRLRVVFPVGQTLHSSRAQSAFMVAEYPIRPPLDLNWKERSPEQEPPFNAITNQGLVIAGSLFSANRGITEYEALNTEHGTQLCLTLLRCVSHLSQGDLSSRRGQAGPGNLQVPLAQCQGTYTFAYTLGLVGESTDSELVQQAQAWRNGFESTFADITTDGIVTCDSGQSVFAGLMPAPDGKGADLFAWAGPEPTWVQLDGAFKSPQRLQLNGEPSATRGTQLGHHQIATLRLRRL